MDIVRNADGTLVVPVAPARRHDDDEEGGEPLPAHQVTKLIGEVLAELDR